MSPLTDGISLMSHFHEVIGHALLLHARSSRQSKIQVVNFRQVAPPL